MTDRAPAARRPLRARPRRAHLPDLGAHLRLQPGLRPLPVQLGPPRPPRAEHRRGQGRHRRARADAGLLRQHRRRRAHRPPRLLGAARLRHRPPRRREVLHQRRQHHAEAAPSGWPPTTTSTCRSRSTAPPPRSTTPCGARAPTPPPSRAMENLAAAGMRGFKLSVVCTRHNIPQLDEFKAIADRYGAQLRLTRLRPSGRGADVWDELHPHRRPAAPALRLAGGARRGGAHRRLVLPPVRLRRGAARPQPVRRRPGRLPDRPGRRRLRLPVRHPRPVPRRQRARRRRLRRACGASPSCSSSCASRSPAAPAPSCSAYDACRGGCMAAKFFTGLPLDGPDPECVKGYGEPALAAVGRPTRPAPAVGRPLASR